MAALIVTEEGRHLVGKRPAWLPASIFPFASRFLELDDAKIHYVDEGQGPVVLFLHPAPASSFLYRAFIGNLRSDFRCIALDYPGFGLSSPSSRYPVTLPGLAAAVARFVEALDLQNITLMVHDTGGPIGLGAAVQSAARYRAFIITDTLAFPLTGYWPVQLMLGFVTSRPFRAWNRRSNLLPRLVSAVAPVGQRLSAQERAVYQALFPTPEARDRILLLFRELIDQRDYLAGLEADLRAKFAGRPALLMYGQFDPTRLIGWLKRFRTIFPMHRVRIVPREGHFPQEGSPLFMIREIRSWYEEMILEARTRGR